MRIAPWSLVLALAGVAVARAGVADLEKELKKALAAKDAAAILKLSEELLRAEDPAGVEVVCRQALLCDNFEAERQIAGMLATLPADRRETVRTEALKNPSYAVRVILSAVLVAYDDPDSFAALCAMVGDPIPSVKLAAIGRLVARGDVRAVSALIGELEKWEGRGGVVAADLNEALCVLTGQDYTKAEQWRKWWNINKASFKREGPGKRESRGRTVDVRRAHFFGHEIVSKKILFILDMSGSMHVKDPPVPTGGEEPKKGTTAVKKKAEKTGKKGKKEEDELPITRQRLYRTKQELLRTIEGLTADTLFTVMAYNHKITMLVEAPQAASEGFKRKAKAFVNSFRPDGETHTDTALKRAFAMADKIDTIYLLSDGAPRRDDKLLDTGPILKATKEANRFRKIKLNTVGFNQAGRSMRLFLNELSTQNDGEYKELK